MMDKKDKQYLVKIRVSKETRRVFRLMAAAMDQDLDEMIAGAVIDKAKALGLERVMAQLNGDEDDTAGDLTVVA